MLMMITQGAHEGEVLKVPEHTWVVLGRKGTIRLEDRKVSQRHACLFCDDSGNWFINDLGSTNGTFVNQSAVREPTRLRNGDSVLVGGTSLVIAGLDGMPQSPNALALSSQLDDTAYGMVVVDPDATPLVNPGRAQPIAAAPNWPGVRRWMPVILLGVFLLVVASQAASYLRAQESIDSLRVELSQRSDRGDAALLQAIEQKMHSSADVQRVTLLQDVSTMLATVQQQQTDQLSRLDERFRQRLAEQNTAAQQLQTLTATLKAQAAALLDAIGQVSRAQATANGHCVFLVDCSGSLGSSLDAVCNQITIELARLDTPQPARVLLLDGQRLLEFPETLLAEMTRDAPTISALLAGRASEMVLHDAIDMGEGLRRALSGRPAHLFLVSDGPGSRTNSQAPELQRLLHELNSGSATRVHAIQFSSQESADTLRAIAGEHRGTYLFVPGTQG
jgi:pSer/pThr/pTyr-binding forkhead associated (FHA) protein